MPYWSRLVTGRDGGRARAAGQTTEVGAQTRTGRRGRPAPSSLGPPCPLLHPRLPRTPAATRALCPDWGLPLPHTAQALLGREGVAHLPVPPHTHSVLVAWGTCFQPCLEVRAPSPSRNREVGLPGPGARLHRRPGTKGPFGAAYVLPLIPLLTGKDTALLMGPLPWRPWLCPLPASPHPTSGSSFRAWGSRTPPQAQITVAPPEKPRLGAPSS